MHQTTLPADVGRVCRRGFIAGLVAAPMLAVAPRLRAAGLPNRHLSFSHTHTGERLALEYCQGGTYLPDALTRVNQILRDFRTGDVHPIDPALLDVLFDLARSTGTSAPFQVISGYRSPVTNGALRRHSHGVASGSLHMTGQAIDIRLADVPLAMLRDAALVLRRGGVGYYPGPDFVHVDTGRVRSW